MKIQSVVISVPLAHVNCTMRHTKIGCFDQSSTTIKLFSDHHLGGPNNTGHEIDWYNWNDYIHRYNSISVKKKLLLGGVMVQRELSLSCWDKQNFHILLDCWNANRLLLLLFHLNTYLKITTLRLTSNLSCLAVLGAGVTKQQYAFGLAIFCLIILVRVLVQWRFPQQWI